REAHLALADESLPLRRRSEPDPGIPTRIAIQPLDRRPVEALERDLGREVMELIPERADPTVREDDIRVDDLAGLRVGMARSDRGPLVIVEPADEVVLHVLRVLLHVGPGGFVLVVDDDRVGDADLLEGLVPVEDAFLHPAAIADGNGVLDVELDRFRRRAHLEVGIALGERATRDVLNGNVLRAVLAEIAVLDREIADASIGLARLESRRAANAR